VQWIGKGFLDPERRCAGARCPWCQALERHRLVWWYFQSSTDLFDGRPKRMLHIAPERCLEPRLRAAIGAGYLTGDLRDPLAMERIDITDIRHPDSSFDVIYCSHVLEHVPDDRRAMAELRRVLKPSGWAVLLVPIFGERTVEDATIKDPRTAMALATDHVRSTARPSIASGAPASPSATCDRPIAAAEDAWRIGVGLRGRHLPCS
jgi:SAM-dependent methyltransferase